MGDIVAFEAAEGQSAGQAGSKALSLIRMTEAGLSVPRGFVLTVDFFAPWLTALAQEPAWAALGAVERLSEACAALQTRCAALRLSPGQTAALTEALDRLAGGREETLFAVRSSSPDEDLADASFAGAYRTILGVTREGVPAAVASCFASAFDERVFLYKRERGLLAGKPRMAVIVQQLVPAESAGVAFSLNPLNNCYDEAVINANYGLGESVVSGAATPDVFVVDKVARRVLSTQAGAKEVVVGAAGAAPAGSRHDGGTAITHEDALRIADLAGRVESLYGGPVDVEWAMAGGSLYLLQARPITTYLPLPPEMVTAPGEPKHLYANSTLIEQGIEGPLSVLGTDFLTYVLKQAGGAVGTEAIGPGGMTFTAGGGYYMDLSYALKLGMGRASLAPGSFDDSRVRAILDGIDMREYLAVELPPRLKAMRGRMLFSVLPMAKGALQAYLRPQQVLRRYQAALPEEERRLHSFLGEGLSLQEQAVALSGLLRFFYGDYGIPMILAGQAAQQRIRRLFRGESAAVQDHLTSLGVALPGNKTTEMGELIYELARSPEIARYEDAAAFLAALQGGELSEGFVQRWQHFMAEFGMRCPREIDPATPRPREDPGRFFQQLKGMALTAESPSLFAGAAAKREAAYRALRDTAAKKGRRHASAFDKYYRTWVTFGGYRETPKHYVIKVIDLFRRQALRIATEFVEAGRLDRPEQIFDLTIADIDRARSDAGIDLRSLASERGVLTRRIAKSRLAARVIDSRGKIFYPPPAASEQGALRGAPISPGVVQGRVKVLRFAGEKPLLPGEILVARVTDPGWTPLFINAAGIVLEIGGALQHGAVVAREYGIPCVSGVDDATERLADGQRVEVDGSNGIVRLL